MKVENGVTVSVFLQFITYPSLDPKADSSQQLGCTSCYQNWLSAWA